LYEDKNIFINQYEEKKTFDFSKCPPVEQKLTDFLMFFFSFFLNIFTNDDKTLARKTKQTDIECHLRNTHTHTHVGIIIRKNVSFFCSCKRSLHKQKKRRKKNDTKRI